MRGTADILFDVTGQELELRVVQGRPTSATFAVLNDTVADDGEAEFTGAAAVDTVATTLAAAAGPAQSDPNRVELASVAGIQPGRKYLLSGAGLREWVDPVEVGADYVRVRHPLLNDYSLGAAFESTYITAAVDADWIADEHNISDHSDPAPDYRVRWSVVVDGATVHLYSYFDVHRALVEHGLTLADLEPRFDGLQGLLATDSRADAGRSILDASWRRVKADLARIGQEDQGLREPEALRELMILTVLRTLAEGGKAPDRMPLPTFLEVATRNHERFFEQNYAVERQHPIAVGAGGDASTPAAEGFWSK